jgi:hypothetical protein
MTRSERAQRLARAADVAAQRAEQARIRITEIEDRLRTLRALPVTGAVTDAAVSRARQAAVSAETHSVESARRALRAHRGAADLHDAAARAHDAAASAHDRCAATGPGDPETHTKRSDEHRRFAAVDRAAADLERSRAREGE